MDWEEGVKILGSALGPVTSRETFLKKITASVLNLRIWLEEVLETSARYQLRMGWRTFVQICSGYKVASYEHERLEFNWVQKACIRLHWHNPISNFKEAIHANMNFKRKHFIKNENVFASFIAQYYVHYVLLKRASWNGFGTHTTAASLECPEVPS